LTQGVAKDPSVKNGMRYVIVGGAWDDNGGRPSGYVKKLHAGLVRAGVTDIVLLNGGSFDYLPVYMKTWGQSADVLIWMPDIPNGKEKLVNGIKEINPKLQLVISKNNRSGKYDRLMLVARALKAKANLLIEFTDQEGMVAATVIDPLANAFVEDTTNIDAVANVLAIRLGELASFTRIPSVQVGEAIPCETDNEGTFFAIVRGYADTFHTLIHAANQNRLLGNVSFRCEHGFPSYRQGNDIIHVSKRNIDKRDIDWRGFVAVNMHSLDRVEYYGEHKPSVDTPIQVRLYNYYKNVRMMLHAHVFVEGAPFTHSIVPCGAIEEFDEIVKLFPDPNSSNFSVNLLGHGSLVLARDLNYMKNIPYVSRI
jgi:hypothetical protein